MALVRRAVSALVGRGVETPRELVEQYPELADVRLREGGLPPRIAGWMLGQRSVSAITLWHTVFVAPGTPLTAELLLHELRHVRQFQSSAAFPMLYVWESLRRGYQANRYEVDARTFAEAIHVQKI